MDIYKESTLIQKVINNKKIAFLDIDLTMTGVPEVQLETRKKLEENGYAIVFVTSRSYEQLLSDSSLKMSPNLTRAASKIAKDKNGKRYHADLQTLAKYNGLLDADAMADTTGIRVIIRQESGAYYEDCIYKLKLTSDEWRRMVFDILKIIAKTIEFTIKECEFLKNYEHHHVEICPPDHRIQIDFPSIEAKEQFVDSIKPYNSSHSLYVLDDSEPERSNYSLYIFPFSTDNLKGNAIDYVIGKICEHTKLKKKDLHILIAGDSYPDLMMLLQSGSETNALYYLVGGSRLSSCFIDRHKMTYLHMDISSWKSKIKKTKKGMYEHVDRCIYVGDELFVGKQGAESMISFLHSSYFKSI